MVMSKAVRKPIKYSVIKNTGMVDISTSVCNGEITNLISISSEVKLVNGVNRIPLGIKFQNDTEFPPLKTIIGNGLIEPEEVKIINLDSEATLILHLTTLNESYDFYTNYNTSVYFDSNEIYLTDREIPTLAESLKELLVNHPYCPGATYDTEWTSLDECLEEFDNCDIDYNQIIRWDAVESSVGVVDVILCLFYQRKEIIRYQKILNVQVEDVPKLKNYLTKHWINLTKMWEPIVV